MAKLMLIDGNSLTYRAFFALPTDMATAHGQVTNAVYGFTSMLINLLRDHRPDHVAVAFDRPEPTFRHEKVEGYKAGRAETPDILSQQMGLVRQVVETFKIPVLELATFTCRRSRPCWLKTNIWPFTTSSSSSNSARRLAGVERRSMVPP